VDAGLFGTFEVGIRATLKPLPSILRIVKANGADGACGISFPTGFGAGCLFAEETASFFFNINTTKIYTYAIIVQTNTRLFRYVKSMVLCFVYFCRVKQ
jgi:hypothetical protein